MRTCTHGDCTKKHFGHGYCAMHYRRWTLNGGPDLVKPKGGDGRYISLEERVWSQVDRNGPIPSWRPELGRCWVWMGHINNNGYGVVGHQRRKFLVHRLTKGWELGEAMTDDEEVDHLCRVRHCCRPDHLDPTTHYFNTMRGFGPAAMAAKREVCGAGHPYTPENTRYRKQGESRICITCEREWTSTANAKKAEAKRRRATTGSA